MYMEVLSALNVFSIRRNGPAWLFASLPMQKEYEDRILFEKPEGEFSVALFAKLPRISLLFPDSIQLPPCAVYDCTWASFILYNDGWVFCPWSSKKFKTVVRPIFWLTPFTVAIKDSTNTLLIAWNYIWCLSLSHSNRAFLCRYLFLPIGGSLPQ